MVKTRKESEGMSNADGKSVTILHVKIDSTTKEEVLNLVRSTISKNQKLTIVTPNPEIVLQAQNDPELLTALNNSSIAIADGSGLLWANKMLGNETELHLLKGRELFLDLLEEAQKNKWSVALIGSKLGSARDAVARLTERFPNLTMYSIEGPNLNLNGNPATNEDNEAEKRAVAHLEEKHPQLVFVGFGAPRQEKWMQKWYRELPENVWMVVGGTFDYVSGKTKLPPSWWPTQFEWVWRLFTKPSHLSRVIRATLIFPFTVFMHSLKKQ